MNAAVEQLLDKPVPVVSAAPAAPPILVPAAVIIDEPSIARAMKAAQQANRPVLEVLAESSGLAGDRYARALAHAFDYRFVSSGELAQLEPDFSILPPAEATRRHCVVVHEGERLLAVFTDPFDETLRGWLELRISAPLEWALAAREELANLIARGAELAEQIISRIKVMSELDIAERRVPQDGRFKIAINGRPIDFRVSIIPSIFGEDAVLRILDKQALTKMSGLRLDVLGFEWSIIEQLRRLSSLPYGLLLVTGPTGSGKTTTLHAPIPETQTGRDKIITIEDPVEYQLPGVLQIPVNEMKGLTFARGLRSILRHDPDKIMVGEIRDPETAQIAIQSALTGHLVFTTVHANNVFDVVSRFVHMGVDSHGFVSALSAVLAQRLVRIVCEQCSEAYMPSRELLEESHVPIVPSASYKFRKGRGCGHCRGTGYHGR